MRALLMLAMLAGLSAVSSAGVVRCADAGGKVSYTDGACPAGSRVVATVDTTAPVSVTPAPGSDAAPPVDPKPPAAASKPKKRRDSDDAAAIQPVYPSGPGVMDNGSQSTADSRWSYRGDDSPYIDDGYAYAYPGGAYRQPPRNTGQKIRNCNAQGCTDTQGNQYNHAGQVIRYPSINGKTCTPVGTTQICR